MFLPSHIMLCLIETKTLMRENDINGASLKLKEFRSYISISNQGEYLEICEKKTEIELFLAAEVFDEKLQSKALGLNHNIAIYSGLDFDVRTPEKLQGNKDCFSA